MKHLKSEAPKSAALTFGLGAPQIGAVLEWRALSVEHLIVRDLKSESLTVDYFRVVQIRVEP